MYGNGSPVLGQQVEADLLGSAHAGPDELLTERIQIQPELGLTTPQPQPEGLNADAVQTLQRHLIQNRVQRVHHHHCHCTHAELNALEETL